MINTLIDIATIIGTIIAIGYGIFLRIKAQKLKLSKLKLSRTILIHGDNTENSIFIVFPNHHSTQATHQKRKNASSLSELKEIKHTYSDDFICA